MLLYKCLSVSLNILTQHLYLLASLLQLMVCPRILWYGILFFIYALVLGYVPNYCWFKSSDLDGSHNSYRLLSTCMIEYKLRPDLRNYILWSIFSPRIVLVTWNMANTKIHLGCPNLVYFFLYDLFLTYNLMDGLTESSWPQKGFLDPFCGARITLSWLRGRPVYDQLFKTP